MAKTVIEYMQCDNPKCNKIAETSDEEPALGLYIDSGVWHHGGGGGPIVETYACSVKCVGPAIEAAYNKAWHGEDDNGS